MTRKKILIIIISLFIVGVAFLAYNFFFKTAEVANETGNLPNNPFGNFFPTENVPSNSETPAEQLPNSTLPNIPKLRQISALPVSGSTIFQRTASSTSATSTETVYRYVERATGHIYEMLTTEQSPRRISNTTIPKIYKAHFLNNKDKIVFQFLDRFENIDTYVAEIKQLPANEISEEKTTLDGVFMRKNILHLLTSPDGKNLFSLVGNSTSNSPYKLIGNLSLSSNPNTEKQIFSSYAAEWIPEWVSSEVIMFNNNASYNAFGYLYSFNTRTRAFEKVLGPINGLVSRVSPDTKKVLYSLTNNGRTELRLTDLTSKKTFVLPNATIAEKCVWGRDSKIVYCAIPNNFFGSNYPDIWYFGEVSFNDSLIKIDVAEQTTETLLNSSDFSTLFDMTDLKLSPKEDYVLFTNKKDLSLWSLEIK